MTIQLTTQLTTTDLFPELPKKDTKKERCYVCFKPLDKDRSMPLFHESTAEANRDPNREFTLVHWTHEGCDPKKCCVCSSNSTTSQNETQPSQPIPKWLVIVGLATSLFKLTPPLIVENYLT